MDSIASPPKPYEKPGSQSLAQPTTKASPDTQTTVVMNPDPQSAGVSYGQQSSFTPQYNAPYPSQYGAQYGAVQYGTPYGQYGAQYGTPYGAQYGGGPMMMGGPYPPMMSQADHMMANMDMGVRSVGRFAQLLQENFGALHMGGLALIRLISNVAMLRQEMLYIVSTFGLFKMFQRFWVKLQRMISNVIYGKPKNIDQAFDEAWHDASSSLSFFSLVCLSFFTYYAVKFLIKRLTPSTVAPTTTLNQKVGMPVQRQMLPQSYPMTPYQQQYAMQQQQQTFPYSQMRTGMQYSYPQQQQPQYPLVTNLTTSSTTTTTTETTKPSSSSMPSTTT